MTKTRRNKTQFDYFGPICVEPAFDQCFDSVKLFEFIILVSSDQTALHSHLITFMSLRRELLGERPACVCVGIMGEEHFEPIKVKLLCQIK